MIIFKEGDFIMWSKMDFSDANINYMKKYIQLWNLLRKNFGI